MKFLHALNKIPGVGAQKMTRLMDHFGNGETIWNASFQELAHSGIGEKIATLIVQERTKIDPEKEWGELEKYRIDLIDKTSERYPKLLKEIHNPPYLLYIKGAADLNAAPIISVVGARTFSGYGKQAAIALGRDLANAGIIVGSGLAIGIDGFAHEGALLGQGVTVGVLGNSLDPKSIAPRSNFLLSEEILAHGGALLSEYPPVMAAGPQTFPARNRIIAGIAKGTIIVEAARKSGSLITAQYALDFNRDVFAVPGSIFSPVSEGTNDLIRNGAKLVRNAGDILEELNWIETKESVARPEPTFDSPEQTVIYKLLSREPIHIDQIIEKSKFETQLASVTLAMMEMKGMIRNIGGQNYIII